MREKHTVQKSIFEHYAEHEIGLELKSISQWFLKITDYAEELLRGLDVLEREVE